MYVRGIDFTYVYVFSSGSWNCFDSVQFFFLIYFTITVDMLLLSALYACVII
jgi:hypothetical protein